MCAVIFRAEVNKIDEVYSAMALQMRQRAIEEYGCIKFTAVTEGSNEIAISYWQTLEDGYYTIETGFKTSSSTELR